MVFWFPSWSTQLLTRHTTISSLDLAFLPGIELTAQSENKYNSYHIESMLLILSCMFRLGYDTRIVASKVGRIMSYNFVYHIICWLVPPKSTEQVPPKRENDHWFRPTLQELISCWLILPKYGTGSQNYRNHFSLSSGFNYILGRNQSNQMIKHCWSHIQNSIMWVSIWPSNGTGLISGWGLNSAPRIRIGVCLGLSGIYSLPVLFSRICPKAVSLFFSSPSGVS